MSKTIEQKIDTIKGWYAIGTVPADCAVYDEKVIESIQNKCKEICQHNKNEMLRVDFLSDAIEQGYQNATDFETPEDLGQSPYNFQTDVFQQNNAFEYFKLGEIVEEYGSNNSIRKGLDEHQQRALLNIYTHVYIPLMFKLDDTEKQFLEDILKLSGGVASWYGPSEGGLTGSNAREYLTKNVNTLEPVLSDTTGGKRNKRRTHKRNGNKKRNNSRKQKRNGNNRRNNSRKQKRNVSKKNNKSRKQNRR